MAKQICRHLKGPFVRPHVCTQMLAWPAELFKVVWLLIHTQNILLQHTHQGGDSAFNREDYAI